MATKHFCDRCRDQCLAKNIENARFSVDSLIQNDGAFCGDCLKVIKETINNVMGVLK